jgi:hypothetical protein
MIWNTSRDSSHCRQEGRDPEVNDKGSPAQIDAMDKRGVQREGSYNYLKTIEQPTLVENGSNHVQSQLAAPISQTFGPPCLHVPGGTGGGT